MHEINRRQFITSLSAMAPALAGLPAAAAESAAIPRFEIIAFSKAFQELDFTQTAELVAQVGWAGIECPVRKNGHIVPERVEDDLPAMVAALAKHHLKIGVITTDIRNATQPQTEKVLRAASRCGIRQYRLGTFNYNLRRPLPPQIAEVKAQIKSLIPLNRELNMCAGFQNHSGETNVGAPVWDIYLALQGLDPEYVGNCFDIAHATIEGGLDWGLHARLMEPFFKLIYIKDFVWQRGPDRGQVKWCPLGQGMIAPSFIDWLKKTDYRGMICQHHEYRFGEGLERIEFFKKDLKVLQGWLSA